MNLQKVDSTLKRIAAVCTILTASSGAGMFPAKFGVLLGLFGLVCGALANSPAFSPATASNLWNRIFTGLAAVAAGVGGASLVPQLAQIFTDGTAHKVAAWVLVGGNVFGYLAQSASGPAPGAVVAIVAFLGLGLNGCATTTQIVKDVEAKCPAVAGEASQDLHIIEEIIVCDGAGGAAGLPACALAALGPIAAAIPGNWVTIQCIADVLKADTSKPAVVQARATVLASHAAKMAGGVR